MFLNSNESTFGLHLVTRRLAPVMAAFAMLLPGACSHDSGPAPAPDSETPDDSLVMPDDGPTIDLVEPGPETIAFDITQPDTSADTSTEPNCTVAPFDFFCACDINSQCASGYCIQANDDEAAMRCSQSCQEDCPNGWECRGISSGGDPVFVCQPPIITLCTVCERDADCRNLGARCIDYDDGKFCGQACSQSPDNCPTGFACDDILNSSGQTIATQCVRTSGSCNCPDGTDYQNDPNNCGICGNVCDLFGSVPTCQTGECVLGPCRQDEGFWNLNGIATDGCEYVCTFVSDNDEPDAVCNGSSCDQNCDGIDGSYDLGIFVSESGAANGTGTAQSPMNSIPAAITKAAQTGKPHVYVTSGTFIGEISMREGVSVYGGYSNDGKWQRNLTANKTILTNSSGTNSIRVVIADGIGPGRTVLDGVEVTAGNNVNPGGSSYAIWARNVGANVIFRNLTAVGGNGGAGTPGSNGSKGSDGNTGSSGTSPSDYDCGCDEYSALTGGSPGANPCGTGRNAAGARGAHVVENNNCTNAQNGNRGQDSASGAPGGVAETKGGDGSAGGAGMDGPGGNDNGTTSSAGFWNGNQGGVGGVGVNGVGGAGGGSGKTARKDISACAFIFQFAYYYGGAGGGGGSGGCGGTAGTGGGPGGGSFGMFLFNASPTIVNARLGAKQGGPGGRGGDGGSGGDGKTGGGGGIGYQNGRDGTNGGRGGRGGNGGRGGHAGGGAGGIAFGLYTAGTSAPQCESTTYLSTMVGGNGGAAGGGLTTNRGSAGTFGPRNRDAGTCR